MQILVIEAILLTLLIITLVTIIFDTNLLRCVIMFSAFSFITMLTYMIMGSPDVAFTEAVIGVVSTVLFVIAIRSLDLKIKRPLIEEHADSAAKEESMKPSEEAEEDHE